DRPGQGTLGDEVEAGAERVRDRIRRPYQLMTARPDPPFIGHTPQRQVDQGVDSLVERWGEVFLGFGLLARLRRSQRRQHQPWTRHESEL
ncbi:hypothetical protein, partial [Microbacterium aoyamense]|uniref:hypothetical protein n=1 Tax=Microbacterium aoyamense TaxID=344166 RepID=UPI00200445E3